MISKQDAATWAVWDRASLRFKLEYLGLCVAGWLVCLFPLDLVVSLSRPLGSLVYSLDSRGRTVCLQNLDAAFGNSHTISEKRRIAEKSYQTFARTMLELFWSPKLTPEIMQKRFHTTGLPAAPEGTPCIYVTSHASNFEWLSLNTPSYIGPGVVVAQNLKNPLLGAYFDQLRSSTGHRIIPQARSIAKMLAHLRSGGYFCAMVDLDLDPSKASVIIDQFDGLKTCVTQIHAALALHTGAKIVIGECIPRKDGAYEMIYHKPLEFDAESTPAAVAQKCWDILEAGIRKHPELWLWSYKHWRFRPKEDPRYPAYANHAKRFDAAIRRQQKLS